MRIHQLLHLGKLVVKVQTLRVSQGPARLDLASAHNMLDG